MIIGAAYNPLAQPTPSGAQLRGQPEQPSKSIQLAEDRISLNSASDSFSATYAPPALTRKTPERTLTQIAWDNLLAHRIGLSREKLDEIEQKKLEIENNSELSAEKKQQLLADLDKEREELIKEAIERRQANGDEERQSNPDLTTNS